MEELPPGFRFYPTEEELVSFYLHNQLQGTRHDLHQVIPVVHIYELDPWHLPSAAGEMCRGDTEQWFFFAPRQEREARGGRPNRTTRSGYWKATGSPSYVYTAGGRVIGVKKTMVFYKGKAPAGRKTKWKMNEYRAIIQGARHGNSSSSPVPQNEYSLCRIYVVSGTFGAFDRRPLEDVMMTGELQQRPKQQLDVVPSSSSSHAQASSSSGVADMEMDVDADDDHLDRPFFDWPEEYYWP
ncbi:unnamed protein product [Linum tenue]|uniref:NAC domain-containing protein n=1 Tax=Linum tenue TaxID=586396 RepID=A0AAV0ILS3_9ROSI|nr:unnamed protein product [Linum tenue]